MQRSMLATDFSSRSDRALRRAVILARAHGATLDLVHVVDYDKPARIVEHEARDARAFLTDLAQTLRATDDIACEGEVVLGGCQPHLQLWARYSASRRDGVYAP